MGVVGLGGLEPPASPLSGVRSNQLSYRPGELPAAVRASLLRKLGGYPNVTRTLWDLLAPQTRAPGGAANRFAVRSSLLRKLGHVKKTSCSWTALGAQGDLGAKDKPFV